MVMRAFGGMTYTWPGSTRRPGWASTTDIRIVRDRMALKMLGCCGSGCWISTKAIVGSTGRFDSNSEKASNPPAEAPMPTIGKACFDGGVAAAPARLGTAMPGLPVALLIGDGVARGTPRSRVAVRGVRGDFFLAMPTLRPPGLQIP